MSDRTSSSRLIHRLAIVTAVVSLAPIGLGSLVTTLGAGMAFPDWPTSDGQGMLAYPWLQSSGDQFIEHGHRLAGMLIGLFSIALCVAACVSTNSKPIRIACGLVLAGVVIQGIIGGARVLLDRQTIAMGHSIFGCCVFVGLWIVVSMTGRSWDLTSSSRVGRLPTTVAVAFPTACIGQYVFGAFIRHLGLMLHSHLGGAVLVGLTAIAAFAVSRHQRDPLLKSKAHLGLLAIGIQVLVGLTVWVTKYGFAPVGLVAVQHSMLQVVSRTIHTVAGMVVVAASVSWSVTVLRIACRSRNSATQPSLALST